MYLEMDYDKLSEIFVNNLLVTNRGFDFYVDWENAKAYKEFEIELNAMNVLIKADNIKEKFFKLVEKVPTVIATFPLLFALSKNERTEVWKGKNLLAVVGDEIGNAENLKFSFEVEKLKQGLSKQEIEDYYYFFERIGLKNLCENLAEKSLTDYVIGVLVGLDSNGRKNRGGTAFEDACEPVIKKICDKYNVTMLSQKQFKKLKEYGFSVSEDIANRKADFILIKDNKALNIEVDYFFRGGSKPEEIIDSYINRQHDLDKLNMGFVLLTDGLCWDNKSKNQLQKGFRNMNYLMNFYLAKNGMLEEVIQTYFK